MVLNHPWHVKIKTFHSRIFTWIKSRHNNWITNWTIIVDRLEQAPPPRLDASVDQSWRAKWNLKRFQTWASQTELRTGGAADTTGASTRCVAQAVHWHSLLAGDHQSPAWPPWPSPCEGQCTVGPEVEWSLYVWCTRGWPPSKLLLVWRPPLNMSVADWILPKEMNANLFFWDSHWLEMWSNHFCPSMGPNGGSVAMNSGGSAFWIK